MKKSGSILKTSAGRRRFLQRGAMILFSIDLLIWREFPAFGCSPAKRFGHRDAIEDLDRLATNASAAYGG